MHRLQELVRLHRSGVGVRKIARLLHMSPTTERRYRHALGGAGLLDGDVDDLPELEQLKLAVGSPPPTQETSSIEAWRDTIDKKLRAGAGPKAIYDWLRIHDPDFEGSYWAVKRLAKQISRANGPRPVDVAIPVDTDPGQVAQVDFGYCGRLLDPTTGKLRRAWVFVMVLGHSRHLFAHVVFDQKATTWLRLHRLAFDFFGGVPAIIVPDNLKAAVIRAAFGLGNSPQLHRSYRELARHFRFQIDPTPPYAPQKKGKVERSIQYVKRSFFKAWQPTDLDEANAGLVQWNQDVASVRVHGSTRRVPLEVFEQEEKPALEALPTTPFEPVVWAIALVHRDAHVQFDGRLYSVPWTWMGHKVWIRATDTAVFVYADDERVATHDRRGPSQRSTHETHLPKIRRDLREHRSSHWELRGLAMGDEVHEYILALFAYDDVLLQLRTVQAAILLLEAHPVERARAACRRALRFGNFTFKSLRNILDEGLDFEPLCDEPVGFGRLTTPAFARDPSDFTPWENA